jgi:hypothetical protein
MMLEQKIILHCAVHSGFAFRHGFGSKLFVADITLEHAMISYHIFAKNMHSDGAGKAL